MNWIYVNSSAIRAVAYDPESLRLYIRFRSGGRYPYYRVSPETYYGLLNAPSKGRYYHRYIRRRY